MRSFGNRCWLDPASRDRWRWKPVWLSGQHAPLVLNASFTSDAVCVRQCSATVSLAFAPTELWSVLPSATMILSRPVSCPMPFSWERFSAPWTFLRGRARHPVPHVHPLLNSFLHALTVVITFGCFINAFSFATVTLMAIGAGHAHCDTHL